jgi:hypothetical protein
MIQWAVVCILATWVFMLHLMKPDYRDTNAIQ